jgi:hypothetical protein
MKKLLLYLIMGFALIFGVIQLIPLAQTNPPVTSDISASPEVKALLKRACYDCHSNETVYPWYSRIAPVSWLVARDVAEGREELNFSTWSQYSAKDQGKKLHESWETVAEGEMPPWYYTILHPEARLSPADRQILRTWARESPQTSENKKRER